MLGATSGINISIHKYIYMSLYFTFESKYNSYRTIKFEVYTERLQLNFFTVQYYLYEYKPHGASYIKFYIHIVNTEDSTVHIKEQCALYFITCM